MWFTRTSTPDIRQSRPHQGRLDIQTLRAARRDSAVYGSVNLSADVAQ